MRNSRRMRADAVLRLTLDGDDELRDDGQDLGAAVLQHVMDSLASQDLVRMGGLA